MKQKMFNETFIEGVIYESKLEKKVSGPNSKNPGTPFINGTLDIQTDDEGLNIVSVHFSYVTEKTSKGKINDTYVTLEKIIDGKLKSVMGKEEGETADLIKIDSAIGLNDFYTTDKKSGEEVLVSAKRNEGGFVHTIKPSELHPENERATFRADMVITSCVRKEPNPEKNIPEKVILKGAIFDFRKALLPVEFSVLNSAAMDYFESLEINSKNPVFTQLKGKIVSTTVDKVITEESAFGEPMVRTVKVTNKDFVVTWAAKETYEWDSEESILASELNEAVQNREVHLAEVKRNNDEYKASRNSSNAAFNTATSAPASKEYNF